jgi:hypothetical protein
MYHLTTVHTVLDGSRSINNIIVLVIFVGLVVSVSLSNPEPDYLEP